MLWILYLMFSLLRNLVGVDVTLPIDYQPDFSTSFCWCYAEPLLWGVGERGNGNSTLFVRWRWWTYSCARIVHGVTMPVAYDFGVEGNSCVFIDVR